MAEHDDLDDLLDSALDDFKTVSVEPAKGASPSTENPSLGQGLGIGLPALAPRGKKAVSTKSKNHAKSSSSSKSDNKNFANVGLFSDALEELARQTKDTLQGMGTSEQDNNADKLVESIVKQFEELGTSEDFQLAMDTMMRQLLSKDVLHEPMKEFCEKYPNWLESNKSSLSEEDFTRYQRQYGYIKELCEVYETSPDDFEKIVDIMQNMQACGRPPDELVQELAPDMPLGEEGLPFLSDMLREGDQNSGLGQNCCVM